MSTSQFSITTAISYPNAKPHLGHALEFAQADFLSRYYTQNGAEVFFQTGLDEHGQKIYNTAAKAGLEPQEFVNGQQHLFNELLSSLSVEPTRFIRTTEPEHASMSQALWRAAARAGDIYKKTYKAWYNIKEEEFLGSYEEHPDASVFGVDPSFIQLIEEENYFFRLSNYQDALLQLIESGELQIVPENRAHEIVNFVKSGLQDVSISRDKTALPWGIEVPDDSSQVMYVWFDALTNYLTGTATLNEGIIVPGKFWPCDLHCVGKDIQRFHAVMWPAMLLSAKLPLPRRILSHGFILANGQKMSKSLGNAIYPQDMLTKYGADTVRWYLLAEIPTTGDGDFTEPRLREVYSSSLANDYGNLVSRVVAMAKKYCSGIPTVTPDQVENLERAIVEETWQKYDAAVHELRIDRALAVAHDLVVFCNRRIEEFQPWKMAKDETKSQELAEHLYELLEMIRHISLMYAPTLPNVYATLREKLFAAQVSHADSLRTWGLLIPGAELPQDSLILFPRLEDVS